MANEAVIIELIENGVPIRYACADGAGIEKGTLGKITDPRTLVATGADNDPFAGIVAHEKVASDGDTSITAYTKGIFDLKLTGACSPGDRLSIGGTNLVKGVAATDLLFSDVGTALENGSGTTVSVFVGDL